MEKETLMQCVPTELMERLKKLLARLWDDKNPAAVHLGAIMDEFEPEVKSLNGVVKEYEADCASRVKSMEENYKERARTLENDIADHRSRLAGLAGAREENSRKLHKLEETLREKEAEIAALRARSAETETNLNFKYVTKMQELYDAVSRKEMEMFSHWEEKNKKFEARVGVLEAEYSGKMRELRLIENNLDSEVNSRKEELLKTFDRVRLELEARERDLAAREEKLAALESKRPKLTEEI